MASIINSTTNGIIVTPDATGLINIQASGNNALQIAANGQITTANAPFILTGGQIQFPAAQIASGDANTLDDYEEGTWTPTFAGGTTAGTYTASNVVATYTKIGRLVVARFHTEFSAASGGAGAIVISGLPFSYKASAVIAGSGIAETLNTTASSSNGITICNYAGTADTRLFIRLTIDNSAPENVPITGISTSTALDFNFTFEI